MVSMWTSSIGLLARAVVLWAVGARFPFVIEYAEHETSSPVKRKPCCLAVICKTLAWAWARETWRWLISTTLTCFSTPGLGAAAVKKQSDSKKGFPPKLDFPSHRTHGGRGDRFQQITIRCIGPRNLRRTRKP